LIYSTPIGSTIIINCSTFAYNPTNPITAEAGVIILENAVYGSNYDGNGYDRTKYFGAASNYKYSESLYFSATAMGGVPYPGKLENLVVNWRCEYNDTNGNIYITNYDSITIGAEANTKTVTMSC